MGFNDRIYTSLFESIQELLDEGSISDSEPAYGVAKQVIHRGYDSLSPKQRTLYDAIIIPALKKRAEELEFIRIDNSSAS